MSNIQVIVNEDGSLMRVCIGITFHDLTPSEAYTLYGEIRSHLSELAQPLTDLNDDPSTPENPPAFPYAFHFPEADGKPQGINLGMTLRDYFSGQALCGLMSQKVLPESSALTAKLCFEVADAMLKARELP